MGAGGEVRIAVKVLAALATTLIVAHFFGRYLPYPDVIAPIFGMWADAHIDAISIELMIECFLVAMALIFGGDWLVSRLRDSN